MTGHYLIKYLQAAPIMPSSHAPTLYPHLGEQIPWAKTGEPAISAGSTRFHGVAGCWPLFGIAQEDTYSQRCPTSWNVATIMCMT
ncbi:hypothetical protein [Pseudomonas sp. S37]|uniref:hypothetical protein n=1 Tax=Pseudomonas sp. S37 TaxID=2767449 RepID=UPI0019115EE4|nr:hypothetical protein [Pseudomonas sp. S37]